MGALDVLATVAVDLIDGLGGAYTFTVIASGSKTYDPATRTTTVGSSVDHTISASPPIAYSTLSDDPFPDLGISFVMFVAASGLPFTVEEENHNIVVTVNGIKSKMGAYELIKSGDLDAVFMLGFKK